MPDKLNSKKVSRRDYLGIASVTSAGAAILFSTLGMLRLPKPRVSPDVSSLVRLGKASKFPPGAVCVLPEQKVCVLSTGQGIGVISLVCTHLGCIVTGTETGFDCPCHGSKFDPDGKVLGGPAPRSLPWLTVSQRPDGTLMVDRDKEVTQGNYYRV